MLGAIIGDVVGSRFEFNNIKHKNFELVVDKSCFTGKKRLPVRRRGRLYRNGGGVCRKAGGGEVCQSQRPDLYGRCDRNEKWLGSALNKALYERVNS